VFEPAINRWGGSTLPRTLRRQEFEDIVRGAIILGCGGGGDVRISRELVEGILVVNSEVAMVQPEEVKDDDVVAVISGMGSPAATKKKGFNPEQCVLALEMLEKTVGRRVSYLLAIETGGGNFLPPAYVAARRGLAIIDGDGVGRAIPEMQMTMYDLKDISPAPFVIADSDGTAAVLHVDDATRCERIGRAIVAELGGAAGVANYLMDGRTMKASVIPGTYTRAERLGSAIRHALADGDDPVRAATAVLEGVELIRGRLTALELDTVRAHDFGSVLIDGAGRYAGKRVRIAFKNENMVAWDERGHAVVISPDLPCIMGSKGDPLTNADLEEGMDVAALAVRCHPRWRTPEGIAVFTPVLEELGYDGPYVPLE